MAQENVGGTVLPVADAPPVEFKLPGSTEWRALGAKGKVTDEEQLNREILREKLLSSMQLQHLSVLAGSGTSLGEPAGGPSMWDFWRYVIFQDPNDNSKEPKLKEDAAEVMRVTKYQPYSASANIEDLLSRCEAFLLLNPGPDENQEIVSQFVESTKRLILEKCQSFMSGDLSEKLAGHGTFLSRLARRQVRSSRVKIFTTNYDLCFERAAATQGLVVIDGFSFTQPRRFDPRFFSYDIMRRPKFGGDQNDFLEGLFHLIKVHGSVDWERAGFERNSSIYVNASPNPKDACLIFPARGKYQHSFEQPHIELISQYLSMLREPNTCLIVVGFGFNDDHLSEPIRSAVLSNPGFRLIIVDPFAKKNTKEGNFWWKKFSELSEQGEDVSFVHGSFQQFSRLIPDLKALTPAQRLANDVMDLRTR